MRRILASLPVLLLAALPAAAQEFPTKPVELIVPWAPGGATDLVARIVASEMEKSLGQPIVVVNKPGAGGMIGSDAVAKAEPDGYSFVIAGAGTFYRDYLRDDTPFDPATAFQPISGIAEAPFVLLASPGFKGDSVAELIALAKENPEAINFASSGVGSTSHLVGEFFQSITDTRMTHIPYEGSAPATVDLLASRVDVFFDSIMTSTENVAAGQVKALAVTSARRAPKLADVPSMVESGQNVIAAPWWAFVGPAGMPQAAVDRLNAAANAALANPDVAKRLNEMGAAPIIMSPAEITAFVADEREKWAGIIKDAGLSIR
jgi:tripartite-type tricarboxylate transporter receptor subunit TctC